MEMRNKYKEAFQKRYGLKLGFMSAFVKASAFALVEQPVVNAVIDDLETVYRDYVDISVAVATPKVFLLILENVWKVYG
jgi:2-oxoglutarate dehydrogenase E2 component (dihydrolipoamide succinyltransferase)